MVVSSSVSFLFSIPPDGHQHLCSSNNKITKNVPRVVDMFHREIDAEAILGHLELVSLIPKSAKFAGLGGFGLTANPNSWENFYSEVIFGPGQRTHQECKDPDDQGDRITR